MFKMKNKTLDKVDSGKLIKNSGVYTVLALAVFAMVFIGVCDPSTRLMGPTGAAAVVGDEVISRSDFRRAYESMYQQYQRQFSDSFNPAAMKLAQTVLAQLVNERVLYMAANANGLRASDEEVMKVLQEAELFKDENNKFSEEQFEGYLRGNGFTEASFLDWVRRSVTIQKLRRFITETNYVSTKVVELDYKLNEIKFNFDYLRFDPQSTKVQISDKRIAEYLASEEGKKAVQDYYNSNKSEFSSPEKVKARHILVAYKGARNATAEAEKRTKEQAKARAQEILAKVKKPNADFSAIAKAETDEAAGKTSGGDLGFFDRTTMVKEFSDAAFAMKIGAISQIVESPFGFHIIKVEAKQPAKDVAFEDAQKEIAQKLLVREQRPKVAKEQAEQVLAALKDKKSTKESTDAMIKDFGVSWKETGEFAASARYITGLGAMDDLPAELLQMKQPGQLYQDLVDIRGNYYILRMEERTGANLADLNSQKREELSQTASYSEGYALMNTFEKQFKENLEKKKEIWMNPEYLAFDQQTANPEG